MIKISLGAIPENFKYYQWGRVMCQFDSSMTMCKDFYFIICRSQLCLEVCTLWERYYIWIYQSISKLHSKLSIANNLNFSQLSGLWSVHLNGPRKMRKLYYNKVFTKFIFHCTNLEERIYASMKILRLKKDLSSNFRCYKYLSASHKKFPC